MEYESDGVSTSGTLLYPESSQSPGSSGLWSSVIESRRFVLCISQSGFEKARKTRDRARFGGNFRSKVSHDTVLGWSSFRLWSLQDDTASSIEMKLDADDINRVGGTDWETRDSPRLDLSDHDDSICDERDRE